MSETDKVLYNIPHLGNLDLFSPENYKNFPSQNVGFKATDEYMSCRKFQYEMNKVYTHKGKLEPCESGFHLCKKLRDVYTYYPIDCRVFLVRYGEKYIQEKDKIVTDTIQFIREIDRKFIPETYGQGLITREDDIINSNIKQYATDCLYVYTKRGLIDRDKILVEDIDYMISKGADISYHDHYLFSSACMLGRLDIVEYLYLKGVDIDIYDSLPLRHAVCNNHFSVVKFLVDKGAKFNVNCVGLACYKNKLQILDYLVKKYNFDLNTNVAYIMNCKSLEVLEYFVSSGVNILPYSEDILLGAIVERNIDLLQFLVKNKAFISKTGNETIINTPISDKVLNEDLILACSSGFIEGIKFLVEHGADVTYDNSQCLVRFIQKGFVCTDTIKYLIEHGANIASRWYEIFKSIYPWESNTQFRIFIIQQCLLKNPKLYKLKTWLEFSLTTEEKFLLFGDETILDK